MDRNYSKGSKERFSNFVLLGPLELSYIRVNTPRYAAITRPWAWAEHIWDKLPRRGVPVGVRVLV